MRVDALRCSVDAVNVHVVYRASLQLSVDHASLSIVTARNHSHNQA
jgi:hypothetical protein